MNDFLHKNTRIIIVAAAAIVFVIAAVILVATTERVEAAASVKMDAQTPGYNGMTYIRGQEEIPVAPIEEEILSEEDSIIKQAKMQELLADPSKIFETIKNTNTVLIGESRTSGFNAYGYLDENHFLGGIGWSIQEIPSLYEKIDALQPRNVIFSFGINELGRYLDSPVYYSSPDIFVGDLENYIEDIKKMDPDAHIFINCIVPCTEEVYQEYPGFGVIPAWNEYIKDYCKEKGYGFIDISDLCAEHVDMYREDGTHLISEFYPYWGARIVQEVLSNE